MRGSSAMPQMGHVPGPGRTTSGCIGQVYSAAVGAGALRRGREEALGIGAEALEQRAPQK